MTKRRHEGENDAVEAKRARAESGDVIVIHDLETLEAAIMPADPERWVTVEESPEYELSAQGVVRRRDTHEIRKPHGGTHYLRIRGKNRGISTAKLLHKYYGQTQDDGLQWVTIVEAPGFAISNQGDVRNQETGKLKTLNRANFSFRVEGNDFTMAKSVLMHRYHPARVPGIIWKPLAQYPGYEVSNTGKLRNSWTGVILQNLLHATGYEYTSLASGVSVHRLVLETFVGPPPSPGCTPNHKNGVKHDNHLTNLEWSTPSEQAQHAVNAGLASKNGKVVVQMNLDGEAVREWDSIIAVAQALEVGRGTVRRAIRKKTAFGGYLWRHVTAPQTMEMPEPLNEQWKPIRKYEGLYEVSSCGRVRNADHLIMSTFLRGAYSALNLSKQSKGRKLSVHRLVAEAFVSNQDVTKYVVVDHKDGNKQNNHFGNLEWITHQENSARGIGRPVQQLSVSGDVINTFQTISEAARAFNVHIWSIQKRCADEDDTPVGGFVWRYAAKDDSKTSNSPGTTLEVSVMGDATTYHS